MQLLDHPTVACLTAFDGPLFDGPLASLGDGFVSRFHSWHGVSGRRYVMSVFQDELPEFDACVVMPVVRDGRSRRALGVIVIERGSDLRLALAQGLGIQGVAIQGLSANEWHVHFLAADRRERAAVAADLREQIAGIEIAKYA